MKKRILHDIKVVFLTLFVAAIIFLIVVYILRYADGYRYFAVHKVGSINLNYEFDNEVRHINIRNVTKDDVFRCLEDYQDHIEDEEEYRKLYQEIENQDENTRFVISYGASILYIEYYHDVDGLFCLPMYGNEQPCRLYIYRVNRKIPEIG